MVGCFSLEGTAAPLSAALRRSCRLRPPPTPAPQTGLFPATVPEVFSFLPLVPVDGLRRGMGPGC